MDIEPSAQSDDHIPLEMAVQHETHDHIGAVFPDRIHAEAAVDELRHIGLGSEHLGVAVRGDNTIVFEHDTEKEILHDLEVGVAVGAPVGLIAGLALVSLAVSGLAVGGILALGIAGATWGGLLGGYFGIGAGAQGYDEHSEIEWLPLAPGEVLVVVCNQLHPDDIYSTLSRNGGIIRLIPKSFS